MKRSAGILLYRNNGTGLEVFLVHPGGPYFSKKHKGWWSIPKGELIQGEMPLDAAIREFEEETGYRPPGPYIQLQPVKQKGGKHVVAWACKGNLDAETITCNTFDMEWPPKSGKMKSFPEIDRAGWFSLDKAMELINQQQASFLHELKLVLP